MGAKKISFRVMLFIVTSLSTLLLLSFLLEVYSNQGNKSLFLSYLFLCLKCVKILSLPLYCATLSVMSACLLVSFQYHLTSHLFHAFVTEKFQEGISALNSAHFLACVLYSMSQLNTLQLLVQPPFCQYICVIDKGWRRLVGHCL